MDSVLNFTETFSSCFFFFLVVFVWFILLFILVYCATQTAAPLGHHPLRVNCNVLYAA